MHVENDPDSAGSESSLCLLITEFEPQCRRARVRSASLGVAALDPLCELWVFVFANNGDFDAYQPRPARYHRGIDDDVAAAALQALRDLYEKVAQREARLAELGAQKVTRALAEKHPGAAATGRAVLRMP